MNDLIRKLGFTMEFVQKGNPQVRFADEEGKLGQHCRPALRSEVRMWCLLTGERHDDDAHWPSGEVSGDHQFGVVR